MLVPLRTKLQSLLLNTADKIGCTLSRKLPAKISAIIFRSKGSVVRCEMLNMVDPKGCFLIPSDLKFSMSRKMAMMRC